MFIRKRELNERLDVAFWKGLVAGAGYATANPELYARAEPDVEVFKKISELIWPFYATIPEHRLVQASMLGAIYGVTMKAHEDRLGNPPQPGVVAE